jgi:hypothetical protein
MNDNATIKELYEKKELARQVFEAHSMRNVYGLDADQRIEQDISYARAQKDLMEAEQAYRLAIEKVA